MDERTERLKNIIIERYGSIREFSKKVNIPSTTLTSALDRGIGGMSVERVVAICEILDLDIKTFKPLQEKPLTSITDKEKELLTNYNKLNDNGKRKLIEYSNDLIGNQRYSLSSDMRYGQIPLFDEIEEEKDYLKPIAAHGSMTENNIIDPRDLELAKKKKQVKR